MKTTALSLLTLLGILASIPAQAAPEPGPLGEFRGNYRGRVQLSASGGAQQFFGPSNLSFSSPASGKTGVLTIRSNILAMGNPVDVSGVYRFLGKQFNGPLAPGIVPTPVTGPMRASRTVIRGNAIPDPTIFMSFRATLQKTRNRSKLTVVQTIYSNGTEVYKYTYTGTRRLRSSN